MRFTTAHALVSLPMSGQGGWYRGAFRLVPVYGDEDFLLAAARKEVVTPWTAMVSLRMETFVRTARLESIIIVKTRLPVTLQLGQASLVEMHSGCNLSPVTCNLV